MDRIVLCGSLDFTREIGKVRRSLERLGLEVVVPKTSEMILDGDVSLERILHEKESGEIVDRARKLDPLTYYFNEIKESDAILVLNLTKDGVEGYIGGNVLIEMGYAHALNKPIYLWNSIPNLPYKDEIEVMNPEVINKDLSKLKTILE
ncbi:hypothetical protein [Methanonatronarchaeum sp. AMET-Sl]|uniref:hypothetical protein n=1 Tax=Methanonatronarchaeum sp. AMET-Sl TaxID=3037654 RepID=UPI00244E497E|nr:hypothetical protein [Methanonatronarchaeum sp. AMET-Sl]WGI16889.1 hypothetical protein QEN48_05165 [Methanonatronarchaeum sp. AMET-Sl]